MSNKDKLHKKKFISNKRSFIILMVLCLCIGYALLSSNLNISGITGISGNKWKIYFDNVQIKSGSVEASVVPTTIGTDTTSLDYTVTLVKPGDFYEFTVDAVNDGTIDAMIEAINITSLNANVAKYLQFTTTYADGTELAQNDLLLKKSLETYRIRVEFKEDVTVDDLDQGDNEFTLSFGVKYVQSTITPPKQSAFIKKMKGSALSDSNIKFGAISSASNGKGLYVMNSTTQDTYPIYYYRGTVENNNALFAGFCWKVVRTTETGGTKLIYNGLPNANDECVSTIEDATQILESKFNRNEVEIESENEEENTTVSMKSPAYVGYMYGELYDMNNKAASSSYHYGSDFNFTDVDSQVSGDGTYTLVNSVTGTSEINTHHYTCFSNEDTCSELYYIYYVSGSTAYYISLKDGESVNDAIRKMQNNVNDSTIKTAVDNWFHNTFETYFTTNDKDYNDYLEDSVWCNDRSMNTTEIDGTTVNNGWKPSGGNVNYFLRYSAYGRWKAGTPNLICSNKNDSFTVTESETGNGALTYPVGLLTTDEIVLAGGGNAQSSFYLYNSHNWWSMTPSYIADSYPYNFIVSDDGNLKSDTANNEYGVRPAITLKPEVKLSNVGDGTSQNPYKYLID